MNIHHRLASKLHCLLSNLFDSHNRLRVDLINYLNVLKNLVYDLTAHKRTIQHFL